MMFVVDTAEGRIVDDAELKHDVAGRFPYRKWLDKNVFELDELDDAEPHRRRSPASELLAAAARVRLHRRGRRADHRADGADRQGADRLDGHRHAARGAQRPRAEPVRLLPPAVRAGDEPADRSDPRGARDVARDHDGSRRQHVRRDARAVPPAPAARPDHRQRSDLAKIRAVQRGRVRADARCRCSYPRRRRRRTGSPTRSTGCAAPRSRRSTTATTC